jgi:uncharacterized protein
MLFELIALGVFTGVIAGFFGMGGGTFLIPILLSLGLDIKTAIGVSVMQMMFASIFGSCINFYKQILDVREGVILGTGGIFGAVFSGYVVSRLPENVLELFFLFLIIVGIYRFFTLKASSGQSPVFIPPYILFGIGAGTGVIAISLGVGGALILNPVLVGYFHYTMKKMAALSLFYVVFSSVSGFASMAYYGLVDYEKGFIVGICSLVGVYTGIRFVQAINPKRHRYWILALYCIVFILLLKRLFF